MVTLNPLQELRAAMRECDDLGYDTTSEAIHDVLAHPDFSKRWECSPRLIRAVHEFHKMRSSVKQS